MSQEREEYVELCRLLALKRHETPPPGYFNGFSGEVISRIRAGETAQVEGFWSRWTSESGWLRRVWSALEAKPALAGGFGAAVCAVLGAALFFSEPSTAEQAPAMAGFDGQSMAVAPERQLVNAQAPFSLQGGGQASSTGGMLSPTPRPSLFNSVPSLQVQPASFNPTGR